VHDAVPHRVFADLSEAWGASAGPQVEFGVACHDGVYLGTVERWIGPRVKEADRRALLGALARATEASHFGLCFSASVITGDERTDALVCIEYDVPRYPPHSFGAQAFVRTYRRHKPRFRPATIEFTSAVEALSIDQLGEAARHPTTTWSWHGDDGRRRAIRALRGRGVTLHLTDEVNQTLITLVDDRQPG
jgi:hypothetical protein